MNLGVLEALKRSVGSPPRAKALPLGLPSLDSVLPEHGLPRGAVVEISSARGLGRATTVVLSAIASAQRLACLRSGDDRTQGAWCAFVDPFATLHAPGLRGLGVDPTRLLVVRPPHEALARTTLKLVGAKVFSVIAIDLAPTWGSIAPSGMPQRSLRVPAQDARGSLDRYCNFVRRLSIANERSDTTVLLLTDSLAVRSMPLPVSMRIDIERRRSEGMGAANENSRDARTSNDEVWFRISKERQGRIRPASKIELKKPANLVRLVRPEAGEDQANDVILR